MRTLLLFALTLTSTFLLSQSESQAISPEGPGKPHFVSFNSGISFPNDDFKEMEFDSATVSTVNGIYGSMEFGFYFTKNFGLGINIGGFVNEVDDDEFEAEIRQTNNGVEVYPSTEWLNVYGMVGPYVTIPLSILYIDFKFMGGAISTKEPLVKVKVDQNGEAVVSKNGEANAIGFGINYGMHVRVKLIKQLGLRLNAEAFSSQQDIESSMKSGQVAEIENNYSKKISAYNLGAGLVFTFD